MYAVRILDNVDLSILRFLTGFAGRSHVFDHFINALSRLDIFKGVALMCLFWYGWAERPAGDTNYAQEERQKRLVRVLIGTILMGALSRVLQVSLQFHQRPVLSHLGLNFPLPDFDASGLNSWNSFPSDHAMFFFALGTGLWSVNRTVGLIAFIWTLAVIDLPRVYLGIHYPSDVVFGALFGFLGMKAFMALPLKRIERLLSAWRHAHQGAFLAVLFFATDEVGHLLAELRDLAGSSAHVLMH
jgi:undecaprenyl-diphosphatase